MSSHFCSEWSFWSSLSKMSKMSNTLIMLTVITSDSSNQSNHFKTLITQWLFNHCLFNHLQKSFNTKFSSKIFVLKITFLSCLFITQQKTLLCIAKIFLSVWILSMLSCILVNIAITCKRNVISTMNLIVALNMCISIASAILLFQWWSEKK